MQPLFERLFDFAGVFPPASHTVAEATRRYRAAIAGPDGWIMGPMLLRASQLAEYEGGDSIGVVADGPPAEGPFVQVEQRIQPGQVAAAVEDLARVAPIIYVERADSDDVTFLDEVAAARRADHDVRAKLRTGGATAESFPSPDSVAGFISSCVELGIPFKATAGLHHPIRTASTVDRATEHGFINLLGAVRCALGDRPEHVEACLSETDPEAFDMRTATWRGAGDRVGETQIRSVLTSIGSCSFDEPAGYLRDLGLI